MVMLGKFRKELKMNNYEKNLKYRSLNGMLAKALRYEFYYEAIFIEYAIIEDRTSSLLRHANITIYDPTLNNKIKAIKFNRKFKDSYIKKHLSSDLLDSIKDWKNKRNALIHDLINLSYSNDDIKKIALEGYQIIKTLSNKSTLVNNYFDANNIDKFQKI